MAMAVCMIVMVVRRGIGDGHTQPEAKMTMHARVWVRMTPRPVPVWSRDLAHSGEATGRAAVTTGREMP
jgi:hypothetical protein